MPRTQPITTIFQKLSLVLLLGALLAACGGSSNGLSPGDNAPAFTLPTSSGGDVTLTDYVGEKPVLLYFNMALG
jgi:hypothetical protein